MRMPPLPADSIHARACKLKCEKILTRPSGAIHLPNPFNLIFGFKLLCNPLLFCQSFNQLKKHDFCLNVNLSQMVIQLAVEKQSVVE